MAGRHRLDTRTESAKAVHEPPRRSPLLVRGAVVTALSLAIVAAGLGFSPHGDSTKGAVDTHPLTVTPPASVDPVPDQALGDPPVLTPALPHVHPSRLVHSQTARVLTTAATTTPTVTVPVQTVPAPAPEVQTVRRPTRTYTTWVPSYQASYQAYEPYDPGPSSSRHHHHYGEDN